MTMKKTYLAPAKINLNLMITDRLENGFHLLDSLVYFSKTIGDQLSYDDVALSPRPHLMITGPFAKGLDAGNDNLICRAAQIFQDYYNIEKLPSLSLEKNLPIASGIGGGSSDAAATIHLLADYFDQEVTPDLVEQLCQLGADIPVCLLQRNCHMSGIGEKLTVIDMPHLSMVLINPLKTVSTPAIFKEYRSADTDFSAAQEITQFHEVEALISQLKKTRNDLGVCSE